MKINTDITKTDIQKVFNTGLQKTLGIKFIELTSEYIKASMPVDERTVQPYGILHGGASAALAETLGSIGSHLSIDSAKHTAVGLEVSAQHLRPVSKGVVTGVAKPIHLGKKIHVWEIRITDEQDRLVCISKLTTMILNKKG